MPGGCPRLNVDGETGFVCPVGDVEAIDRKKPCTYCILITCPPLRKMPWPAPQHFDVSAIVPQYEALYEQVVKQNNRPAAVSHPPIA